MFIFALTRYKMVSSEQPRLFLRVVCALISTNGTNLTLGAVLPVTMLRAVLAFYSLRFLHNRPVHPHVSHLGSLRWLTREEHRESQNLPGQSSLALLMFLYNLWITSD